jgi:cytoskeletal protein CcmA (bactofilin family)
MFGRKKPETPKSDSATTESDLPPLKLRSGATAPAQPSSISPVPTTLVAPVQPKFDIPKRPSDATAAPVPPRPAAPPPGTSTTPSPASEGTRLLVGRDIMLSGEINTCDQLVVEGRVEATLSDTRAIEIRESGYFKGNAEIDDAVINGVFEGNLTVRNRLLIHATGKISGKIRYGMLEVECGGQLSGDVQMVGEETKRSANTASTGGSSLGLGNGGMTHNNQAEGWRAET